MKNRLLLFLYFVTTYFAIHYFVFGTHNIWELALFSIIISLVLTLMSGFLSRIAARLTARVLSRYLRK